MSQSIINYLEEDHQSITFENALGHLGMSVEVKSQKIHNAELKDLILEDFEGMYDAGRIKRWEWQAMEFYMLARQALEFGDLSSKDDLKNTSILNVRIDPKDWFNWLRQYREELHKDYGYLRNEVDSILRKMEKDLDKLRTIYPDKYEEGNSIEDEGSPDFLFRKTGDFWAVRFKDDRKGVNLKHSLGMDHICSLLMKPNDTIWSKDIYDATNGMLVFQIEETIEIDNDTLHTENATSQKAIEKDDSEKQLERRLQRNAYREVKKMDQTIKEAEEDDDTEKADKLKETLEEILSHLKKSRNIRGDVRAYLSEEESARQKVQKSIKRAIDNMRQKGLTNLADHLTDHLSTGSPCIYRPPIEKTPDWSF